MVEPIFKNYGGSYQLRIQDAQDLEKIQSLDEALWAATSIPIDSLNCDSLFASLVDTDRNGRIRTDELRAAQLWAFRLLKDRTRLSESSDVLRIDDIDTGHEEGRKLRAAAEQILANLNVPEAKEITLAQVRDRQSIVASSAANGDGIITPEAASDGDLAKFIASIMDTIGSTADASGKSGIGAEQLSAFFSEAEAYLAWKSKGKIPDGVDRTKILPWGTETPQAYELVAGLEEKLDQYFTQCAIVRFDERSAAQMKLRQKELDESDFSDTSAMEARLKNAPLAVPDPQGVLDLNDTINPLYANRLSELRKKVLDRVLGESAARLTKEGWDTVKALFAPYRAWIHAKQGSRVEKLGAENLRACIDKGYKEQVSKLIDQDLSVAEDFKQIKNLEKLILYQRYLLELANNFVSFANLYNPDVRSLFEAGTLVIGGRELTFTLKVRDRQAHRKIAEGSHMYLLYVEVTGRKNGDVKFEVVAAVTATNAYRLNLGKRGIFFTRDGQEWDARVIDIVENPISIWESVKAPFLNLVGLIKKQINKFTKARQAAIEKTVAAPSASGFARDIMLGGGVAIAALGASAAYITKAVSQVEYYHVLAVIGGLAAIILIPNIVIGFSKLRKRDMSVILEASGCAVNVCMRLTSNLGRLFTRVPTLPEGSRRQRADSIALFAKNLGCASSPGLKRIIVLGIICIVVSFGIALLILKYLM